jgi:hypothetical protein
MGYAATAAAQRKQASSRATATVATLPGLPRAQAGVLAVEAVLGAPGDLEHVRGLALLAVSERRPGPGRAQVVPGRLDQQPAGVAGAGLGDGALAADPELSGNALAVAAKRGRLRAVRRTDQWYSTRQWVEEYKARRYKRA